tara:strand:- start:109 stop:1635 length:1527 start_codon:yes stop_codon:yes gene_type:complete
MAINFLDNVQFNKNQLLGARLQVETADANVSAPVSGQVIYNSTSNKFKYYNGTSWVDPSAGSYTSWQLSADSGSGTIVSSSQVTVSGTGAINTVLVNPTGNIFALGVSIASATSTQRGAVELFSDTVQTVAAATVTSTANRTYGLQLNSAGQAVVNVPWADTTGMNSWTLTGDSGTQTITNGNTVSIQGGVGIITAASATDILTVTTKLEELPDTAPAGGSNDSLIYLYDGSDQAKASIDSFPINEFGAANGTLSMGNNKISGLATPAGTTDAATKAYVDSAVAGGLNVKGGFNASTGVTAVAGTNLYTNTAVAIGDYYTVTVSGNFFGDAGIPLTPGDSVLAQTAAASGSATKGNFAVIQSDTDLATVSTVGLGNTNIEGLGPKDGLSLGYATGTATLGIDINSLPSASGANSESIFLVYDGDQDDNRALGFDDLKTAIAPLKYVATSTSSTTHTFNHNLNSRDVVVQIYSPSSYETVYATVDRTTVNQVVVTTASSQTIRALIFRL